MREYLIALNGKFVGKISAATREAANKLAQAMYGEEAYVI